MLNKEKTYTKVGIDVSKLLLVKDKLLVPEETVGVEDRVRLGVFPNDTDTVFVILEPKGLIRVIV